MKKLKTTPQTKTAPKIRIRLTKRIYTVLIYILVTVLTVFVLDFFFQFLHSRTTVAVVNGKRLKMADFKNTLYKTYGAQEIENMIIKQLIASETKKQKINITKEELDAEIKKAEDSYGGKEQFKAALEEQGLSQNELKDLFKIYIGLNKLAEKRITPPTEEEIKAKFEAEKKTTYKDKKLEDVKGEIANKLKESKIAETKQAWVSEQMDKFDKNDNYIANPYKYKPMGFFTLMWRFILGK